MRAEPTPYESTGTPRSSKNADPLRVEAARGDDLDPLEPGLVERVSDLPHEALVHPGRPEVAHLLPEGVVDEGLRGVEPHPPEPVAERAGDLERRLDRVVLEVDEDGDVHVGRLAAAHSANFVAASTVFPP